MIIEDKVIVFCVMDNFVKNSHTEPQKSLRPEAPAEGARHRNHKGRLSESEIMTILTCYHSDSFRNFRRYYMLCVRGHLGSCFPDAVSCNRLVGLMPRVSFRMTLFMKLRAFGKRPGISFADSTMLPVCHNLRRHFNKVFKGIAADGKSTTGWRHSFKLRLLCNGCGEIITFCLTRADVSGRDARVRNVSAGDLYGKVFADRRHVKLAFSEELSDRGIHLVHGLKADMRNSLMPMWDKIMLRKRYVIECINGLLKDKAGLVRSRHRSAHNFMMNICPALTACCFSDSKPEALPLHPERTGQLGLF